jgi:phosphonate C-P lyase system protein PhnH
MSTVVAQLKENRFDFVHDSQRAFRSLMMAAAFPGKPYSIDPVPLCLPRRDYGFIVQPFLTLVDLETSFHVHAKDAEILSLVRTYLEINTNGRYEDCPRADFILCLELKKGSLVTPHKSATVFYLADRVLASPGGGATELALSGPGIKAEARVYVAGIQPAEMEQWSERGNGYPRGVDVYIVSRRGETVAIPRSVAVRL